MSIPVNQSTAAPESFVINRQIGSTLYHVGIHFNPDAKETLDDKILRLLRNDLNPITRGAIIGLPQTGRLPEGSSL